MMILNPQQGKSQKIDLIADSTEFWKDLSVYQLTYKPDPATEQHLNDSELTTSYTITQMGHHGPTTELMPQNYRVVSLITHTWPNADRYGGGEPSSLSQFRR